MKAVFFGQELRARCPKSMGVLLRESDLRWIGPEEILTAIQNGEEVTVRPATKAEYQRAEAWVAMGDIGGLFAVTLRALMNDRSRDEIEDAICNVHEVIMAASPVINWLDKERT